MSAPPQPQPNLPILEFIVALVFGIAIWTLIKPGFDTAKGVALNTTTNETAVQGINDTVYIMDNLAAVMVLIGFFGIITAAVFLSRGGR